MVLNIRQNAIVDLARREGRVLVEDLARRFDVTLQTIRRDLGELSEAGCSTGCMAGPSRATGW